MANPDRRAAALEMLDELRGLFECGTLSDARRFGAGCLTELEEAFAVDRMVSEEALGRPIVREPAELAALCERARTSFAKDPMFAVGQVRQILQLAADLGGGPRATHELRDDCGRTIAFARLDASGFQMMELPIAVLHPAAWADAAARVGIGVDELRELGPSTFADQLGGFLVRSIPRIRPEAAPARYFLPRDRFGGTVVVEDPLATAYTYLASRTWRYTRCAELNAPAPIVEAEARSIQRAVDSVAEAAATAFDPVDAWEPSGEGLGSLYYRGPEDDAVGGTTPRVVWLTDDRIAVTRDGHLWIVSVAERRVVRHIAFGPVTMSTCDDSGRYVLAVESVAMIACVDTETGEWLGELPPHVTAIGLHKNDVDIPSALDEPDDRSLFVFELRREKVAAFSGDCATLLAWARGARAILVGDNFDRIGTYGIRSTDTLLEPVSANTLLARAVDAPVVGTDAATDVDAAMRERWNDRDEDAWPSAIAQVDGRWRFLLPTLHVADVEHTWFRLGFAIDAASFSPDGRRLAVLGDELCIVDIEQRAITWRGPF